MSWLKRFVPSATLSGAFIATGQLGVVLLFALGVFLLALVGVVALTGVYGQEGRRDAAQTVLRILLGRDEKPR